MSFRIVPFLIALCAPLCDPPRAQDCPDLELHRIDQRVTTGPVRNCNTLQYVWRGIRIGAGVQGCPTFVIIETGYDSTRHRAGASTYAVPSGRAAVTRLSFSCDIRYLLFIPLSSVCNPAGERVIAHRTNYDFHPCALLPGAEPTVGAGTNQQGE